MRLGSPRLRVRDLDGAVAFYERDIGLRVKRRYKDPDGFQALELGFKDVEEPLLRLKHDPNARRPRHDFAGLYHYAVLLPDRRGLASTFLAVGNAGVAYEGFADHSFSEALYLHDPEMNGMEFYADRPRNAWPDLGTIKGGADIRRFAAMNKPLDLDSLLRELNREERAAPTQFPGGAKIGHMHLRVTDLEHSVEFYHQRLGFDIVSYFPEIGAAFLSVGGYHHHIGLNTWQSRNGSPHKDGDAGLDEFKMVVEDKQGFDRLASRFPGSYENGALSLVDPDGIRITVEP